ncbi:putative endopeptidase p60 precursor [Clostridium acetireducens DSM 10703]|jgi:peptidoglycan hydrolase CwlO-like protein|uniref:Putative endopeptidase p60 n=1 Tax=Clostridium acetireducens DSM 10703 TaxID=1121290 RepID=A0A1E8EYA3_9CLOT|nr:C40 family peptidase [Clostridium acetireducens]OFI05521.1 putative endopeptidase p60 precursor [Clostridium acetireducens DSM 10703]
MKGKALSVILALALTMTVNGTVLAAPSESGMSLNNIQSQRKELEVKVEKLDNQIETMISNIGDNKKEISKTEKEIKDTSQNLKKAQDNIESQQDLFNKRVRAMYINGVNGYLEVLLDSNGLSDFVSRVDTVKKVVGFDKKVISDLNEKKQAIENKRKSLDSKKSKLISLKENNEKKLQELNTSKDKQNQAVENLKRQERMYAAQLYNSPESVNSRNVVKSSMANIQQVRNSAPSYVPSRGSTSTSSSSIVAYATNFLGRPYQWGGNGPDAFDCSGFTKYVYAHFGIGLPRIASDQQGVGTSVSRGDLQPGDLVFFGSPAHHVGIYVGNGCYIHAPRTGDVIKVSPLNRSDYSGARRVR